MSSPIGIWDDISADYFAIADSDNAVAEVLVTDIVGDHYHCQFMRHVEVCQYFHYDVCIFSIQISCRLI